MTTKLIFIFAVAVEVLVGAAFAEDAGRSPSEVDTILTGGWKFSKDPTHKLAAEGVEFDDSGLTRRMLASRCFWTSTA